jgi:hypothetical protein
MNSSVKSAFRPGRRRKWLHDLLGPVAWIVALVALLLAIPSTAARRPGGERAAAKIVEKIMRADYEGNRLALKQLFSDLQPFLEDSAIESRVHYWRGYAMWRSSINGFNDQVDVRELQREAEYAIAEFDEALALDASFVDAKAGKISCLGILYYISRDNAERARELLERLRPVAKSALAEEPENPRLLWVLGTGRWSTPVAAGGGQEAAISTWEKGLKSVRASKGNATRPLDPTWGEPELLMNLAWANMNRTTPDPAAAESNARAALKLVPYWHYMRDILIPQIEKAQREAAIASK